MASCALGRPPASDWIRRRDCSSLLFRAPDAALASADSRHRAKSASPSTPVAPCSLVESLPDPVPGQTIEDTFATANRAPAVQVVGLGEAISGGLRTGLQSSSKPPKRP